MHGQQNIKKKNRMKRLVEVKLAIYMAALINSISNTLQLHRTTSLTNKAFYIMGYEGEIIAISSEFDSTKWLCISHRSYEIYRTQIRIHHYEQILRYPAYYSVRTGVPSPEQQRPERKADNSTPCSDQD